MIRLWKRWVGMSLPGLIALYVPAVAIVGLIAAVAKIAGIPSGLMTRDPTAIMHAHPFTGVLSNLGAVLWAATASVCFFGGLAVRRKGGGVESRFLLCSGVFVSLLLFDDMFRFHDSLASGLMGLPEEVVFGTLGLAAVAYAVVFLRTILNSECAFLGLGCALFALSIVVDIQLLGRVVLIPDFFDDASKFLGIFSWCAYFFRFSLRQLSPVVPPNE